MVHDLYRENGNSLLHVGVLSQIFLSIYSPFTSALSPFSYPSLSESSNTLKSGLRVVFVFSVYGELSERTVGNNDCGRSVARLVLQDLRIGQKHWQALASGLTDSGCRLNQVSFQLNICQFNSNLALRKWFI